LGFVAFAALGLESLKLAQGFPHGSVNRFVDAEVAKSGSGLGGGEAE